MAALGTNYNPASVMMGNRGRSSGPITKGPYIGGGAPTGGLNNRGVISFPWHPGHAPRTQGNFPSDLAGPTLPAQPSRTLAPESVRATGSGPFDAAYRQNLASYAGGQFAKPGGSMSFNPTDPSTFPGMATGGGTAPVTGMPQSLLDMALGGQGFSWQPPPAQTAPTPPNYGDMQQWLDQFMRNGRGQRNRSFMQ